jgi:hypothetical protein
VRSDDYHFVTVWRVAGTVDEVADVLGDGGALTTWWPSVYLDARQHGEEAIDLWTTGWLPYTLRWTLRITEPVSPAGFALSADGDLVGAGRWTFRQDEPEVEITYDWRVHAAKPLLRRLGWLLRPVFEANHRWAMARGQESLALELRRRRARTPADRAAVPAPPPPTFRRLTAWWSRARLPR